jgi:hypothetical protein
VQGNQCPAGPGANILSLATRKKGIRRKIVEGKAEGLLNKLANARISEQLSISGQLSETPDAPPVSELPDVNRCFSY